MAATAAAAADYPLNCIDGTGDGFSGWFAISDPRRCNDFCYWDVPSPGDGGVSRAAWNVTDPHRSAVVRVPTGTAYWTCVYDGAEDGTTVAAAEGERWIDSWEEYRPRNDDAVSRPPGADDYHAPFPYLRCQKGAGERLKTFSGEAVRSAGFWEGWIVVAASIFVGEIVGLVFFFKRGKRLLYENVDSGSLHGTEGDDSDDILTQVSSLQIDGVEGEDRTHSTSENGTESYRDGIAESSSFLKRFSLDQQRISLNYVSPHCKYCSPLASAIRVTPQNVQRSFYILRTLVITLLNLLLAFTISFSAISLMEINANPHFKERMQKWTPACSDPSLVCPSGNKDIDGQSAQWPPLENSHGRKDANELTDDNSVSKTSGHIGMRPFSYIIASDSQLYWFNGEFSEMGEKSLPSSCSPSDSCGRCTGKHGLNTNSRLKKAWEGMMTGKTNGLNATGVGLPIPNTLVMNGDLTAYFHPYEKRAYDSVYDSIEGLKYYFPSLGNHDIEHPGGAMYGGDEWVGQPNCNMEHAIGYFRGGFCGRIPAFDAGRIVRYDSSSLAYSWDEGRFHFVHTHYYPTYEMASVRYHSSLRWLERDLRMARDAGLATVLFVHAAQGLNRAMEDVILGKNVRAIMAGHTHRCLHRRCEGVSPLHEDQAGEVAGNKCFPAAYDTCQVMHGENYVYAKDTEAGVTYPKKRLHNEDRKEKPLCPKPAPLYINETDNSMLCRQTLYCQPNFPFKSEPTATETIPIFWSGSSSFETFLRGDFYEDRIVINAMTVESEGAEAARYVDLYAVPNAVYPYHNASDIEETVLHV